MRRSSAAIIVFGGVLVLIGLIAGITYIAWNVINRTVQEQFQTADLQLVTALAQQTQASLNNLSGDITQMSIQEDVRAIAEQNYPDAQARFADQIEEYPPGAILSITRFDFRGIPQYAYPPELNAEIEMLDSADDYMFTIPDRFIEISSSRQGNISQIPIETHLMSRRGGGAALLLIAPVDSVNRRIGFIAYEIQLEPIFKELFDFVDIGDTSQLWVLDAVSNPLYQARPEPSEQAISGEFSSIRLFGAREPQTDTFTFDGETFNATFARTQALNQSFVIFLSRNQAEAQQGVTENVISIFGFSVTAMLAVVGLGLILGRQFVRTNRERRLADQRRESARILLEVSRALNSSLEITTVLKRIMNELQKLVPHDSASILLLEDDGLRVAAASGASTHADTPGNLLRLEETRAAREVIAGGYPIVINDTLGDPRWTSLPGESIQSWVGLPLRVRDQLVGVLNINSNDKNHFSSADIELAEGFADQASVALQNAQLHELEVTAFEQELSIARGIQESLLPDSSPDFPFLDMASMSRPASQVSGDYFQYLPLPDGRMGIAIGDVQGKGIPAALMMAVIMTALRDEITRHDNSAEILQSLNTRLLDRMQRNHMNSALIIGIYDPRTQLLELANGGMVQPYFRAPNQDTFDFVQIGGYPLGISDSMRYSAKELHFRPGSTLVIISDGVLEAQNRKGEFFGFERIEALLNALPPDTSSEKIIDTISAAIQAHLGDATPQDDTSILVLRAQAVDISTDAILESLPSVQIPIPDPKILMSSDRKRIELNIPSIMGFEKVAMGTAGALAREIGFDEDKIADIQTAVSEACMNAIEHGNALDYALMVNVILHTSEKGIEARIRDHGKKTLSQELPPPGQGDMRGWGLFFMTKLMDRFEISHLPSGGNQVMMVCYLPEVMDSEKAVAE